MHTNLLLTPKTTISNNVHNNYNLLSFRYFIMDSPKVSSSAPLNPRNQIQRGLPGRSSPSPAVPSTSSNEPFTEYKVRVPRNLAKKYYMMRFQSGSRPDLSNITKATMSRATAVSHTREEDIMPKSGAGSEYGRERREEARKRRRGYAKRVVDPDAAPWNLRIGGKGGKRYSGRKEAGINENSNYYILTQCPDGAFEAVPVTSWYNFTPNINYRTLTTDEAEEEFLRRDKTVNFFSLMVKKRLQNNEEDEEKEKSKGGIKASSSMKIYDDADDLNLSLSDDDDDDNDRNRKAQDGDTKKQKKISKSKGKAQTKAKKGTDEESDASSEEDGYFDSKEVDYMSDSSSSSEDIKVTPSKPDTKDDLNAGSSESESEDDEDLTNAGKDIKKLLQKDQGDGGSSEEEDEDPEGNDVKGTSALFLQDKKRGKKKTGSRSSTSSSSRSSTPTAGMENQAISTVAAAAKKLEGRPGTPTGKGKKRPATENAKTGFVSISDSPSSKKARISPGPSSRSGSASNTPTPADNGNSITEDSVRRYLARKPMTTKDLLQKFKTKKTGLTNEQTVQLIATILKKVQPEQKTIKGKLYLSLKSS